MNKHISLVMKRRWLAVVALLLLLFVASVSTTQAAPQESGGFYHTVQYGEYLSLIAQRYGVSVQAILNANPHITNPNLIYYGTVLFIPSGYHGGYPSQPSPGYGYYCRTTHYVRYGENLSGIARWYGVSPFAIAEANQIYNLNRIYAGQYLCIP